jgi:hypothetical protein
MTTTAMGKDAEGPLEIYPRISGGTSRHGEERRDRRHRVLHGAWEHRLAAFLDVGEVQQHCGESLPAVLDVHLVVEICKAGAYTPPT